MIAFTLLRPCLRPKRRYREETCGGSACRGCWLHPRPSGAAVLCHRRGVRHRIWRGEPGGGHGLRGRSLRHRAFACIARCVRSIGRPHQWCGRGNGPLAACRLRIMGRSQQALLVAHLCRLWPYRRLRVGASRHSVSRWCRTGAGLRPDSGGSDSGRPSAVQPRRHCLLTAASVGPAAARLTRRWIKSVRSPGPCRGRHRRGLIRSSSSMAVLIVQRLLRC